MRWLRRVLVGLLVVLLLATGGFVFWAETPLGPMPEALTALQSTQSVRVTTTRWLVFEPATGGPEAGLVFYPGARVDPRSYAPEAQAIAAQGFLVVIVPMPLNLAILAPSRALEVIRAFPSVKRWTVGGHSLGGTAACMFVRDHPELAQGVVLWASYPNLGDDLSRDRLDVVQLIGTRDGVINRERLAATAVLLPPDTQRIDIEGGNHAQFGWYGDQPGDTPATISRADQQRQIVAATVEMLDAVVSSQ